MVAPKCHAKIVIFFHFSDFFSDFFSNFFSDFLSDFFSDFLSDFFRDFVSDFLENHRDRLFLLQPRALVST